MGLLTVGKPYSWADGRDHRKYVRDHGVVQFLNTYNRVKDITNDELLWGDEVRCANKIEGFADIVGTQRMASCLS